MVSEPNRNAIRNKSDWIYDNALDVTIKVLNTEIIIKEQGSGIGYAYVITAEYSVYSVYTSGNDDIKNLETLLDKIGGRIKRNKEKAVIGGDFNAKSPQNGE